MNKLLMALTIAGTTLMLSGCIIAPPSDNNHHHHNKDHMITRDGVSLPDCETLADASQADNGSRCWYR